MEKVPAIVFTLGHGARTIDDFLGVLDSYHIRCLVDVRTVPRSRHNHQFNKDALSSVLEGQGIDYRHAPGLGGFRHPRPDSVNDGWRNESFRGFADYMATETFGKAMDELVLLSAATRTVLVCAETLPWRCHRSLIADALTVRGIAVEHIFKVGVSQKHRMTPWARTDGNRLTKLPRKPLDSSMG